MSIDDLATILHEAESRGIPEAEVSREYDAALQSFYRVTMPFPTDEGMKEFNSSAHQHAAHEARVFMAAYLLEKKEAGQ